MKFQAPRGTHDVLPKEAPTWRFIEQSFLHVMERYGYEEVRTPAFEDSELFLRSAGQTSDIVTKQMYRFKDLGDRDLCLKPEGTAPAIRAFLENNLGSQGDLTRLWYNTQIFRYERPQKGRYRQAHQVGFELIGSRSPDADAEVVWATLDFYRELGIQNLQLRINSIGKAKTRADYRTAILQHARAYLSTLEEGPRQLAEKNPLRLLDSKDPNAVEAMADAPNIQEYLEEESRAEFDHMVKLLDGLDFVIDPRIVRGLDYYNDLVFEVTSPDLGAQSSLCGGGRYDGLIEELGGPPTPAVGVAMGIERAVIVLEALGKLKPTPQPTIFLIHADDRAVEKVRSLAQELRKAGISALYDLDHRGLKQQFKRADRAGAIYAGVIGETELNDSSISLKLLATGEQWSVSLKDLANSLVS